MKFKYKTRLKDIYRTDKKMGMYNNMEHFYSVTKSETDLNYIYPIKDILINQNLNNEEKIKEIGKLQNELYEIRKDHFEWHKAIVDLYLNK